MSRLHYFEPVDMRNVDIAGSFIGKYQELVRTVILPYQWEVLNNRISDVEPSNAILNFKIAAGLQKGDFYGEVFQDTDLAKWIEGASYSIAIYPDADLEKTIDEIIDIIGMAQEEDGYLNTYFSIQDIKKRWTNLYECHELYTAGHMIEAAVAYYNATGKRRFLDIMCKCADHIVSVFGEGPGQISGYPGHQEVELALIRLFEATNEKKYLELCKYFILKRGEKPNYFIHEWETSRNKCTFKTNTPAEVPDLLYNQSHLKIYDQKTAVGHSVRAMYMYSAMAELARLTDDKRMTNACRTLWEDVTDRQMYITGGIGSTHTGEAFTFDYDLPNETAYAETCASIGLAFFAHRMQKIEMDGKYADIIEKILYNVLLASVSSDGKTFLYVNPMEIWPEASLKNPDRVHVKPARQSWYGCACCPPNIVRFINSFGEYIYSVSENAVFVHQYISGKTRMDTDAGKIELTQTGSYPWDGKISITVNHADSEKNILGLRIPGWCRNFVVWFDGEKAVGNVQNGYFMLENVKTGTKVEIIMEMPVQFMYADPRVRSVSGKVAIQRGPVVYCIEETDNAQGLNQIRIDTSKQGKCVFCGELPEGIPQIICQGYRMELQTNVCCLYTDQRPVEQETEVVAIPYYYWGNRGYGEMQVWIRG